MTADGLVTEMAVKWVDLKAVLRVGNSAFEMVAMLVAEKAV